MASSNQKTLQQLLQEFYSYKSKVVSVAILHSGHRLSMQSAEQMGQLPLAVDTALREFEARFTDDKATQMLREIKQSL